ncbi:hypothetical protein, partial [uncultured Phocaeicola sp.]|uniref:hypothetical protein n=1 Tax=uncultured Phocaeicola sp. TaxID=990718 RepID=UPI002618F18F
FYLLGNYKIAVFIVTKSGERQIGKEGSSSSIHFLASWTGTKMTASQIITKYATRCFILFTV